MTLNRLSGILTALLGLALLFGVIPNHTETTDYGWLRPATLPNIAAIIIVVSGCIHLIFPKGKAEIDWRITTRVLLFLGIGVLGLWLMSRLGFVIGAPVLMLVLMLVTGERRYHWLAIGIIVLPSLTWFCVDFLLKRPLP